MKRDEVRKTSINYSPFARGDQRASEAGREPLNEGPVLQGIVRLVNVIYASNYALLPYPLKVRCRF